jgi:hypothetical protein
LIITAFQNVKRGTLKAVADRVALNSGLTRAAPTDLVRDQNIFWLKVCQRKVSFLKPDFFPRTAGISIEANPASQKPRRYDPFSEAH